MPRKVCGPENCPIKIIEVCEDKEKTVSFIKGPALMTSYLNAFRNNNNGSNQRLETTIV